MSCFYGLTADRAVLQSNFSNYSEIHFAGKDFFPDTDTSGTFKPTGLKARLPFLTKRLFHP
jgi:hypothetical protein